MTYETVAAAARRIAEQTGRDRHDVGLVLGSGLGGFADGLSGSVVMDSKDLGFPQPKVAGHAGHIVSAEIGDGFTVFGTLDVVGPGHLFFKDADLVIFDAERLDEGPIATVRIPVRLKYAIHGNWVAD